MRPRGTNRAEIDNWIVEHTPQGGRVLDIGCGTGDLLGRLVQEKGIRGTGIEIAEDCVVRAVQRGLSVHHGNVEEGLDHYGDQSFDLVVMSLTIQELNKPIHVLRESFRVGRRSSTVMTPSLSHR